MHRSPASAARQDTPAGTDAPLEGPLTRGRGLAQQFPGLADSRAWHSRGASHLHQQRLPATAVRTGAAGVHTDGAQWQPASLGLGCAR